MNAKELRDVLGGSRAPEAAAAWLRGTYLPAIVERFNGEETRKRLGLYPGEHIPRNERNLTDVRNRVSLIIEYELARLSNEVLGALGEKELFWSYVVANRFPDLEVRWPSGEAGLRIEVKCIQSIAEEKSANFDTLRKDLHHDTDFVVVFVWEWDAARRGRYRWDRAPRLLTWHVFHAASLAALRDCYWLNRPPPDLGGGRQGFDLRYAVNCKQGRYAQEEGNYGKLLRIWDAGFPHRPPGTPALQDTERAYLEFVDGVIASGFWSLCDEHLPRLSKGRPSSRLSLEGREVGARAGEFGLFRKALVGVEAAADVMRRHGLRFGVLMTDKYVSSGYEVTSATVREVFSGRKPKVLSRRLFGLDGG